MSNKPTLDEMFRGLHRQLESELEITRSTVKHTGTMGTVSENKWVAMLTKHLPTRYKVNRAFVVDSTGMCSDQIDVVVHDRQYSPFVFNHDSALYVPAESVYAVLEVKQNLIADHVADAGKRIASVRKLHRTSLPIDYAGGKYAAKPLHHILGVLLALESDWHPPFGDPFREAVSALTVDGRLDMGCAVRHGVFAVEHATNKPIEIVAERSEATLALFLMRFISRLQSIATVPCIDVLAYAANMKIESAD